jgi:hypothetical protein
MTRSRSSSLRLIGVVCTAAVLSLAPVAGQGGGLTRTPDGKPDLQGIWQVVNAAAWNIQDHAAQKGVPAGRGVVEGNAIPYQSWAADKQKQNFQSRATTDPENECFLPGVPRITYMPYPLQIVQTPDYVAIAYEYVHAFRIIYTNGTPHPKGPLEFWMGDSRGHWEGNTLVVDVVHFNDATWFDRAGNFHSDALHVVERYSAAGPNHLTYDVTIEDPKVFTRPWKMSMPLYRRQEKGAQLLEYECYAFENGFRPR